MQVQAMDDLVYSKAWVRYSIRLDQVREEFGTVDRDLSYTSILHTLFGVGPIFGLSDF